MDNRELYQTTYRINLKNDIEKKAYESIMRETKARHLSINQYITMCILLAEDKEEDREILAEIKTLADEIKETISKKTSNDSDMFIFDED